MSQRFTDITAIETLRVTVSDDPTSYIELTSPVNGVLSVNGAVALPNVSDPDPITDTTLIYARDTAGVLGSGVSSIALRTEEPLLTGSYTANRAIPAVIKGAQVLILCQDNEVV